MKFEKVKFFNDPTSMQSEPADLGFYGSSVDERGEFAKNFLKEKANLSLNCRWDKVELLFCLGKDLELRPHEISSQINELSPTRILIEATTLGFVEILFLVSAAKECPTVNEIEFIYVEPREYSEVTSIENPLPHNFALSKSLGQLIPIPGFTKNFARKNHQTHLFAFLGFEPARLGRVLEDDEGAGISKYSLGIGIPAFVPGWENHTTDSNSEYLDSPNREEIVLFSANNPQSAYDSLCEIADSLSDDERIVIAPFGTKPAGLGAIVYAVLHQDRCGIIYDHPIRQKDRSKGVGKCHLYKLPCTKTE